MKQTILLFSFALAFSSVNSQRLIALEHNNTSTFHRYLDSAIYYATSGDNIYLPGGAMQFSGGATKLIVDKAVHVYGTGYHPDSSGILSISNCNSITIRANASGGSIEGISCGSINFGDSSNNSAISNFTVKRCKLGVIYFSYNSSGWTPASDILFSESIFSTMTCWNSPTNVVVEKSFIGDSNSPAIIYSGNSPNDLTGHVYRNNIFYGKTTYPSYYIYMFGGGGSALLKSFTFENNIFYTSTPTLPISGVMQNCQFSNNIFNCDSVNAVGSSSSLNNFFNQSLLAVFQTASSNTYSFTDNYHLLQSCVGKNAGTDGTDIGIYGTSSPFKEGGLPINPHIISKNIASQTTGNGILQINVKVKAQDN